MGRKRENVFLDAVKRHLPDDIYVEKTCNPFRRGMPDCYYEAQGASMWVEYKWLQRMPSTLNPSALPEFTKLQQRWLKRAAANGQRIAVIIGSPEGALIFPGLAWTEERTVPKPLLTTKEVSHWIQNSLSSTISLKTATA